MNSFFYLSSRRDVRRTPFGGFPILFLTMILVGCGAAKEQMKPDRDENIEALHKYEKTFNPADYDPEIPIEKIDMKKEHHTSGESSSEAESEIEIVSGFRVQVSFTDNIEQANKIKNEVSTLITDQTAYVVYEAPYYKVRVGDFLNRPEANTTLRALIERGYKDAWIVPDRVKKQP